MHIVHMHIEGMHCDLCPTTIQDSLAHVDGVAGVLALRGLGLTSVLYDEDKIRPLSIAEAVRSAGFKAEIVRTAEQAQ